MRKKIISYLIILSLSFMPLSLLADNSETISYLQAQEQNSWITQALAAAGVTGLDISYIDVSEQDLMPVAKYLLALAAVNSQDATTVNALITTLNGHFNNGQLGEVSQLNDDFWGLLALAAVSSTDNIESIKNFIVNNQNPDHGWSWTVNDDVSDTNDTAAAIMALLDAGVAASDSIIVNALSYLQAAQNIDGGFGYYPASESDGASTAWIIAALNKANIDPATWQVETNNPLSFLETLRQADGSFLWMSGDEQSSLLVTAYALLSLIGSTYPVNYIDLGNGQEPSGQSIRIESPENTICLADNLSAETVLDLLIVAATVCNFEYVVEETDYGPYVSSIAGIDAEGMNGWQYWVNWQGGTVSVDNYQLADGDQVLWGYGGWPMYAVKVEANLLNENDLLIQAEYFDESWQNLVGGQVLVGTETYITDANGQVAITLNQEGVYQIYAEQAEQYVRSNKEYVNIGSGISQNVDLTVDIDNEGGGGNNNVSFIVDQSAINFGELEPGQSAETILQLTNTGNIGIYLEANVAGDNVLIDFTTLDQAPWDDFAQNLNSGLTIPVSVQLTLPADIPDDGQKTGQLIFWAVAR